MTPAITELDAAAVAYSLHEYDVDDERRDFGLEAATKLELDPDRVFKTIVVRADADLVVAIVPVSCQVSMKGVGRAIGVKRVEMCDPAVAEKTTGYVRGGISPFGQRRRLPTVIDETATIFDVVYVSGGKRGLDIGVDPRELIDLLGAVVADIT